MHLPTIALALLAAVGASTFGGSASPLTPAAQSASYSTRSLRGSHGFTYSGSLLAAGPVASSGRIDFDGNGHLRAVYTTSVNGTPFFGRFSGNYTVNPDGTGSVLLRLPRLGLEARGDFVLVDHGRGTFFTSTDAGFAVTGTTKEM
jgi:hypothetical protein